MKIVLLSLLVVARALVYIPVQERRRLRATVPRAEDMPKATDLVSKSKVIPIENDDDFLKAMQTSQSGRLVVVKFYASWCRACKSIEPRYKRLANEFQDIASFYEIEFSANKELCRRLEVKKLPCVQLYRGEEGFLDTVLCGPSKFPDVRTKIEALLGIHQTPVNVPEFTDLSEHYRQANSTASPSSDLILEQQD